MSPMARFARGILWLGVVIAVSVAGSGLVLALDHPQTDAGRPELTARGDALVEPRLAAIAPSLSMLADAANGLAEDGRDALVHLRGQQVDLTRSDLAAGDAVIEKIAVLAPGLKAARDAILTGTSVDAIARGNADRVAQVSDAVDAMARLATSWTAVTAAAPAPIAVLDALAQHDKLVVEATDAARTPDWDTALLRLSDAATSLRRLEDTSAGLKAHGFDVTTLDGWVLRLSDFDGSLVKLYTLLQASNGAMTAEASAALDQVNLAKAALPPDNAGLSVIVSDIGGQRITEALLAIERARGAIEVATGR
jgi:hypothetical protein